MTADSCSKLPTDDYDQLKELQEFENTRLGVKGLVDSGITRIPLMFHHPPETLFDIQKGDIDDDQNLIPVTDMSCPHQELVQLIRDASAKFGFFQVVNHGTPTSFLDRFHNTVKAFHELPPVQKMLLYRRDASVSSSGVSFFSNYDLFQATAAGWRDTLEVRLAPNPFNPNIMPDVCRDAVIEWDKQVQQLSVRIMELLSEGLGLSADRLKGSSGLERSSMVGHYYPYCPEPTKTVGVTPHTDSGTLTVLLQDQVGGLQVKYQGKWVHLKPVHGALVIIIGDLLQVISNDEYKSREHFVLANPLPKPRVSVAVFFKPAKGRSLYGPLPELVSAQKPALHQPCTFSDLVKSCLTKGA